MPVVGRSPCRDSLDFGLRLPLRSRLEGSHDPYLPVRWSPANGRSLSERRPANRGGDVGRKEGWTCPSFFPSFLESRGGRECSSQLAGLVLLAASVLCAESSSRERSGTSLRGQTLKGSGPERSAPFFCHSDQSLAARSGSRVSGEKRGLRRAKVEAPGPESLWSGRRYLGRICDRLRSAFSTRRCGNCLVLTIGAESRARELSFGTKISPQLPKLWP